MSFKLNHSNSFGEFKLKLHRELSKEEMEQICQLAHNLLSPSGRSSGNTGSYPPQQQLGPVVFGPRQEHEYFGTYPSNNNAGTMSGQNTMTGQKKLGEFPVETISLGDYKEPSDGVRLKVVHFPDLGRTQAIKALRDATGISMYGCKDIIYGNYLCPILTLDVARTVLDKLKSLNIFAKIIPANET